MRERLDSASATNHAPEVNGDMAGSGETAAVSTETEPLEEELQRALEALKASEASRMDVETLLAEAKQVRDGGKRASERTNEQITSSIFILLSVSTF